MQALLGFMWLLIFQTVGELLARALPWPLPGPVLGMALLVFALGVERIREQVRVCAEFLLAHLALLFIPVASGVMVHWQSLSTHGVALLAVLLISTVVGLVVTAGMAWWLVGGEVAESHEVPVQAGAVKESA